MGAGRRVFGGRSAATLTVAAVTSLLVGGAVSTGPQPAHAQEWGGSESESTSGAGQSRAASRNARSSPAKRTSASESSSSSLVWSPLFGSLESGENETSTRRPSSRTRVRPTNVSETEGDGSETFVPRSARERRDTIRKRESWSGKTFAPQSSGRWQWKVTKEAWSEADEDAYGVFLKAIGESDCKTTHDCLTSPTANPLYHVNNPPGWKFFADCADLPFVLRAYFAWMNGLPFSYSTALALVPGSAPKAKDGERNETPTFQIVGRRDIVPPGPDGRLALADVALVSTGHFRTAANYDGRMLPDHYPVKIDRASVKAGTVMFDPLGHIAVVYKVTDDGLVHFIDAHPDNSLTRGVYGSEIERAGPESGAGFKRWRPQRLVGAKRQPNGTLAGGEVVLATDKELPDWSDEQYYGIGEGRSTDWRQSKYTFEGDPIDYYGFVRMRLARPGFRYDPVIEVRTKVDLLCKEVQYRVQAVKVAIDAGIDRRPQPVRLPMNIYVTQGDWETYATPSRDAQLKSMFRGLREDIERFIDLKRNGSKLIVYAGGDLATDLLAAYTSEAQKCTTTYIKSDGSPQSMSFEDVKRRLFRMSFDPHHCVERRWGAEDPAELASCKDNALKQAWYVAQQRLRNQLVRTIGDRMNFTLDDLNRQAREDSDVGENEPPAISVADVLTAPAR